MTEREREFLTDMDDSSVEEIAEFSEGLDSDAKKRILEKCRSKMKGSRNEAADMKADKNYTDTDAEVKHIKKSGNIKIIASAAACFAVIIGAAAVISSMRTKENMIRVSPDPTVTALTSESVTSSASETKKTEVSGTSDTRTETSPVTVTSVYPASADTAAVAAGAETEQLQQETKADITAAPEINYEEEYRNIFIGYAGKLSDAYLLANGYGAECSYDADALWYDYETNEVFYHGDYASLSENRDSDNHRFAFRAFPLNDPRFSSRQEFKDYMTSVFTEDYFRRSCTAPYLIEYDGKLYAAQNDGKGILFDGWDTDNFSISDIVPEESFAITSVGHNPGGNDAYGVFYGKITFVRTPEGWRADNIEY